MRASLAIAHREWRSLFASPLAWSLLAGVQIILGVFFFLTRLDTFLENQPLLVSMNSSFGITAFVVTPLFESASMLLLFVIPLICMHSIAGERSNASLALLMSAPISMTAIVVGKYLAYLAFVTLMCALISLMPLSLLLAGNLDPGLLAAAFCGLLLMSASYAAVGLYVSSLTPHPVLAAAGSFAVLAILALLRSATDTGTGPVSEILAYLSVNLHGDAFLRGIVNSTDLAFFALFITGLLIFTVRRLDALRTHG